MLPILPRVLLVVFVLAHAAIHGFFLLPRPAPAEPGPAWPFDLDDSWLLRHGVRSATASRAIGSVLIGLTVVGYALAALAVVAGLAIPWAIGVLVGTGASLALLVTFFHRWLAIGVLIDAVLLWVVVGLGWAPVG